MQHYKCEANKTLTFDAKEIQDMNQLSYIFASLCKKLQITFKINF